MIVKFCMRNLLIIWKISTEKNFGKSKKKFLRFFFKNFFQIFFRLSFVKFFISLQIFWSKGSGEGERSEPSAGGLETGAEGSVNSEFIIILDIRVEQGSFPRFAQSLSAWLKNKYFAF